MNFQLFKLDLEKVASQSTSLSRVRLFATPWTVAYQAPPSMAFSRQEYWSGLKEPEIKLSTSVGSSKKQESSRKNIYFYFIDFAKAFDCVDHHKLWKILQEMGIPDHLTCLLRNLYAGCNSYSQTWNNRLVPNQEGSMARLYIVTLLI